MRDFIIATASTCDIDRDWLDSHDIPVISYTFTVDGKIYIDDCRDTTRRAIYAAMREGKQPNTSQITTYNYYEFFKKLLSEGNRSSLSIWINRSPLPTTTPSTHQK